MAFILNGIAFMLHCDTRKSWMGTTLNIQAVGSNVKHLLTCCETTAIPARCPSRLHMSQWSQWLKYAPYGNSLVSKVNCMCPKFVTTIHSGPSLKTLNIHCRRGRVRHRHHSVTNLPSYVSLLVRIDVEHCTDVIMPRLRFAPRLSETA